MTDQFIDPVFPRWLSSALTPPGDGVNAVLTLWLDKFENSKDSQWYSRGFVGVYPQENVTAKQIGLKNGFTIQQNIAGDRGTNFGKPVL